MIIYKTTNLKNNKIYIGQDSNNNPSYLGSGTKLKLAVTKYGKENFIKETLEECNSADELNQRERYWIKELKSQQRSIGYNITDGGQQGFTDLVRKRISKTSSDRWDDPVYREKCLKNLQRTSEEISKTSMDMWQKPEYISKMIKRSYNYYHRKYMRLRKENDRIELVNHIIDKYIKNVTNDMRESIIDNYKNKWGMIFEQMKFRKDIKDFMDISGPCNIRSHNYWKKRGWNNEYILQKLRSMGIKKYK